MAIEIPDNDGRIQYTATGGQTVFPYDFPIEDQDHIVVIQNSTTLVITTNYTVSGVGNESGGNITLISGATLNDIITIYRDAPIERVTNFSQAGDFLAEDLNDQLNYLTMAVQDVDTKVTRVVSLKPEDTSSVLEIPVASERASKFLAFDGDGDAIASAGTVGESEIPVSAYIETLLDDADASTARTTLGLGTLSTLANGATTEIIVGAGASLQPVWTTATGSGAPVRATSPTITTPTVNQANLVGTTTNDNAAAGSVGQLIESTISVGSAVSITSTVGKTITSISLTAGDWDVWGNIGFIPASTMTKLTSSISLVDNTDGAAPASGGFTQLQLSFPSALPQEIPAGTTRISVATTTTDN